jgi:hypothetical protein
MVTEGIKTPVQEPTEWLSRMIVVGKPDCDVRICLDPSELNKAIQRLHFLVPTIRRLFRKLSKVHYFLSLDAASGFHQIPLTNEASFFLHHGNTKRSLHVPQAAVWIEIRH